MTVVTRRGERWFVAECVEIPVVTQGRTVKEAIELYFEGEGTG